MELFEYRVVPIEYDKERGVEDNIKVLCGQMCVDWLDLMFINQLAKYCPEEEILFRHEN